MYNLRRFAIWARDKIDRILWEITSPLGRERRGHWTAETRFCVRRGQRGPNPRSATRIKVSCLIGGPLSLISETIVGTGGEGREHPRSPGGGSRLHGGVVVARDLVDGIQGGKPPPSRACYEFPSKLVIHLTQQKNLAPYCRKQGEPLKQVSLRRAKG